MKTSNIPAIIIFFLSTFTSNGQVFPMDTIQYNGDPSKLINIVILSDGYIAQDMVKFRSDALKFNTAFFDVSPYKEYRVYFNVFTIQVPSNESGASHPGTANDVSEPAHPVSVVDNYFGSTFDYGKIHRLLVPTYTSKIFNVLAANFPLFDQVVMLTNSSFYGGSGGQFATTSLHTSSHEVGIHEIGHSFARLKDEYYAGDSYASEGINMTKETNPTLVKWKNWHGINGIGVFQHCCSGNSAQWYKPHQACKMQTLSKSFCSVCVEATIERIHQLTKPIISYSPITNEIISPVFPILFSVKCLDPKPNTLQRIWKLNNVSFALNQDNISLMDNHLENGINHLVLTITDTSSFLKVNNHASLHFSVVNWTIDKKTSSTHLVATGEGTIEVGYNPNPFSDILKIDVKTNNIKNLRLKLFDFGGKLIFESEISGPELIIDTFDYAPGTYIATLILNDVELKSTALIKI